MKASWEGQDQVVVKEFFEVGDSVVAWWDWAARGRASGMETRMDLTTVNTIENGKIVRLQYYIDHDEALKAVGLEGEPVSQENVELEGFSRWMVQFHERLVRFENPIKHRCSNTSEAGSVGPAHHGRAAGVVTGL